MWGIKPLKEIVRTEEAKVNAGPLQNPDGSLDWGHSLLAALADPIVPGAAGLRSTDVKLGLVSDPKITFYHTPQTDEHYKIGDIVRVTYREKVYDREGKAVERELIKVE